MQPEEALRQAGDFGLFQYLLITYLCVLVAPVRVMPLFAHIFSFLVPPHHCKIPPHLYGTLNVSREALLDMVLPREPDGSLSQCRMYDVNATLSRRLQDGAGVSVNRSATVPLVGLETTSCQFGWEYNFSLIYPSVVSEMNWVCENSWKAYVANTVFWVSTAVGVLICGNLSDRCDPALCVIVYCWYTTTRGGSLRMLTNMFRVANSICSLSDGDFLMGNAAEYGLRNSRREIIHLNHRGSFACACVCELVYVRTTLRDLSLLNIVKSPMVSMLPLELSQFYWHFVLRAPGPEDLKDILTLLARFPPYSEKVIGPFMLPSLRLRFLHTDRMLACLVYTAGQLYAANASHNPFLMTTAVNAVDIVATATALPLADRWGRRPTMMTTYSFAAVAYLFAVSVPAGATTVETLVFMLARMALTMAYNVGYLHAAEVYPTAVRSQALSVRQAFGSVGKFLSSQVTQLAMYGRPIPLVVMGAMSFLLALLTFPLPETLHHELPETLKEGEEYNHAQNTCCFSHAPQLPPPGHGRTRTLSVI
ncbi:unnamed protein product [Ixodes hexagonus]